MCRKRKKTASYLTLADKKLIELFVFKLMNRHFAVRENSSLRITQSVLQQILLTSV